MSLLLAAGEHGHLSLGFSVGSLILRVVLLAAVPVVAAFAMMRGFLGAPSRRGTVAIVLVAMTAATMELLLSGGLNLPDQAIPLLLLALALPVYLVLSRDERFAAAVGLGRRLAPLVFAVVAVLAAVQFGLAWFAGAGRDRTAVVLHTGVLLGLVALVWFVIAAPRRRLVTLGTRAGAALLGIGLLAGAAQAITMRTPDPVPGSATQARLGSLDVLVVPNLPGWNLVHVSSATAAVGVGEDPLVPAAPRPGATGGWLAVELPAGPSDVRVRDAGSFTTDTCGASAAPEALAGADGPECVSAMLGRMTAGSTAIGMRCPSEKLDRRDADTLRTMVDVLAERGHDRVALAGDRSPRGVEALDTVRAAAAARGVELVAPGAEGVPLLLTSGWAAADTLLRQVAGGDLAAAGTYLAPWLFSAPLLSVKADQHVGMGFDAAGESFQRYRAELRREFPGQTASAGGYQAWLAERRLPEAGTPTTLLHPNISTVD
jgi:hypothetical protein